MDARALRRKDAFRGERPWGDTVCDPWISDRETRKRSVNRGRFLVTRPGDIRSENADMSNEKSCEKHDRLPVEGFLRSVNLRRVNRSLRNPERAAVRWEKTSNWEGDPPGELTVPQTDTETKKSAIVIRESRVEGLSLNGSKRRAAKLVWKNCCAAGNPSLYKFSDEVFEQNFDRREVGPFQIVKLTLTIGFVRYPRSTGCSASVSLLYAVRNPIRLDGRRTSLNPTDYVKQFSGLARIRVTENREERKRALPIEMSVTRRGLGFHSFDETKWSLTFIPPRSIALKSSDSFFLYATQKGESPTRLLAQHTHTHKSTPQKSRRSYLNEMAGRSPVDSNFSGTKQY
ncbi:UNVERIFIED_CONTAM: hypothetical protein Scaly_2890400 [Sesamum calycinum]|uniref:Uncharacterized protein n=1 Tax=Sesamum calycinum TaxID=2727403 RepID=A0AAW2L8G6_9LAMI